MTGATTWKINDEAGDFVQWANLEHLVLVSVDQILVDGMKLSVSLLLLCAPNLLKGGEFDV